MCKLLDKVQPKNRMQLEQLIDYAFKHKQYDLNFIDTSKITDMSWLFEHISCDFDVSNWDVSNVTNMSNMFRGCKYFNYDLSNWDVSNVTDMSDMFYECEQFNCDLSNWDVSNVTNMTHMFSWCNNFEGKGLENWNLKLKNIKFYYHMFYGCDKNIIPNWYKKYNF